MSEKEEKKLARSTEKPAKIEKSEKVEKSEKPARKEQDKPNFFERTRDNTRSLWREMIGELRKVSWPTWKEAMRLTRVVLVVMVIMMIILGGLDRLFTEIFKFLVSL